MDTQIKCRLYVEDALRLHGEIYVKGKSYHYLRHVMRCTKEDNIALFNGHDGTWQAGITHIGKRDICLTPGAQIAAQGIAADIWLYFAPLKKMRMDYLIQKAVEMGVKEIHPIYTAYTQKTGSGMRADKLRANAIEAAEQCAINYLPKIHSAQNFTDMLKAHPDDRMLVYGDEMADLYEGHTALTQLAPGTKLALCIGPEGGFSADERMQLHTHTNSLALNLGPRILRADTACVAALGLLQFFAGDWRD